ncbi:hypothetical protein Tco_0415413 [Tanacetum coccineum]
MANASMCSYVISDLDGKARAWFNKIPPESIAMGRKLQDDPKQVCLLRDAPRTKQNRKIHSESHESLSSVQEAASKGREAERQRRVEGKWSSKGKNYQYGKVPWGRSEEEVHVSG